MSATPHVFISSAEIPKREFKRSGVHQIDADYAGSGPVYLIAILKGACIFLADLARAMKTPARLEFMGISSYGRGEDVIRTSKSDQGPGRIDRRF